MLLFCVNKQLKQLEEQKKAKLLEHWNLMSLLSSTYMDKTTGLENCTDLQSEYKLNLQRTNIISIFVPE